MVCSGGTLTCSASSSAAGTARRAFFGTVFVAQRDIVFLVELLPCFFERSLPKRNRRPSTILKVSAPMCSTSAHSARRSRSNRHTRARNAPAFHEQVAVRRAREAVSKSLVLRLIAGSPFTALFIVK